MHGLMTLGVNVISLWNTHYSVNLNALDLLFFTELANTMKYGEGSYVTLFSPIDVTAFHKIKHRRGGYYITLFSPSDVTAFHRIVF